MNAKGLPAPSLRPAIGQSRARTPCATRREFLVHNFLPPGTTPTPPTTRLPADGRHLHGPIAAWVKLPTSYNTAGYDTAVCQLDDTGQRCGAYLQYSGSQQTWAFVAPSSDARYPGSYAFAHATGTPTAGAWTRLAATYNSATHAMALYVNGALAGSGTNDSPWSASGPLLIGGADGAGVGLTTLSTGSFTGSISAVTTYPYALTSGQVVAQYHADLGAKVFAPDDTTHPDDDPTTAWSVPSTTAGATNTMTFTNGVLTVTNGATNKTFTAGSTPSTGTPQLVFQVDGNLVIYPDPATASIANGNELWSSVTGGHYDATLALQPDGKLVIYNTLGTAVWTSGT
ncbi:D-mannose binding lectin [Streptomyces sp. 846.5]|nr:LamG domain-containing protein [Streptomyces sp. 846.5]TDU02516.1 D-mannose binding lectin [Streptomyces sp. 846.5]